MSLLYSHSSEFHIWLSPFHSRLRRGLPTPCLSTTQPRLRLWERLYRESIVCLWKCYNKVYTDRPSTTASRHIAVDFYWKTSRADVDNVDAVCTFAKVVNLRTVTWLHWTQRFLKNIYNTTRKGEKGKGSPYLITERSLGSGADLGSWQSACRWRES